MVTSSAGINRIKKLEGFSAKAYPDAGGHSIGYGHYIQSNEAHLLKATLTDAQATKIMMADIKPLEAQINRDSRLKFNQNQFDAMIELGYNIGSGALAKVLNTWATTHSTDQLFTQIRKYKYSNGVVNDTLVQRRETTIKVFSNPIQPIVKTAAIAIAAITAGLLLFK